MAEPWPPPSLFLERVHLYELQQFKMVVLPVAFAPDRAKELFGLAGTLFKWIWTGAQALMQG